MVGVGFVVLEGVCDGMLLKSWDALCKLGKVSVQDCCLMVVIGFVVEEYNCGRGLVNGSGGLCSWGRCAWQKAR